MTLYFEADQLTQRVPEGETAVLENVLEVRSIAAVPNKAGSTQVHDLAVALIGA
ncbi:hypothetical protein QBK99_00640 [Corticibacterium sp. UT-5YL-CI-8]|nr:hypothetical protein [Tianweitania sp. UT-5YL-CI-8]